MRLRYTRPDQVIVLNNNADTAAHTPEHCYACSKQRGASGEEPKRSH